MCCNWFFGMRPTLHSPSRRKNTTILFKFKWILCNFCNAYVARSHHGISCPQVICFACPLFNVLIFVAIFRRLDFTKYAMMAAHIGPGRAIKAEFCWNVRRCFQSAEWLFVAQVEYCSKLEPYPSNCGIHIFFRGPAALSVKNTHQHHAPWHECPAYRIRRCSPCRHTIGRPCWLTSTLTTRSCLRNSTWKSVSKNKAKCT